MRFRTCVAQETSHKGASLSPCDQQIRQLASLAKKEEFYFETTNSPSLSHSKGDR